MSPKKKLCVGLGGAYGCVRREGGGSRKRETMDCRLPHVCAVLC